MKNRDQHSEQWLDGAIRQLELQCQEAARYDGDEYNAPTVQTVVAAKNLMTELQNADNPQITLTQDGEIVLNWEHEGDKFKAIVRCDGSVAHYQNKKIVGHEAFAHRLTSVPA
jgi:hypothetical protein